LIKIVSGALVVIFLLIKIPIKLIFNSIKKFLAYSYLETKIRNFFVHWVNALAKQYFDPKILPKIVSEIQKEYPIIKVTAENIPTRIPDLTPFELIRDFSWITLDIRWLNIHLRGYLVGTEWVLQDALFVFYEALNIIKDEWRYSGLFTLEIDGDLQYSNWKCFKPSISKLKSTIST
jgi:hypothetical protein